MRRILIDRARSNARLRHGGQLQRVDLEHVTVDAQDSGETVLAINEALTFESGSGKASVLHQPESFELPNY